ncbi:MAG: leucine-rich repeat protein [Ruminococcus sp.]|nr:leucine-rich repeat protein [Ruminococcus sp.]
MKKVLSLTLTLLILTSVCAFNTSALEDKGFTYTEDEGKAVITGYEGSETNLVIPAVLGGLKVEEIEDNAFYQNHNLSSVTIENGIKEIGDKAFYNCTGLSSVTIPDSVREIGDSAFSYCVYLTDVTLGKGLEEISNNCFSHNTRLASITIPEGVKELDDGAFEECTHLYEVTLPSTLKEIGKYALAYTYNLSSITLPQNLEIIDEGAFYFNSALTEISVPASVKTLGNYAFYSNSSLYYADLNEGLTTIGDMAFDGTALTSLYIPSTVTLVGSNPFGYTFNEETFEYELAQGFTALCVGGSLGAQLCDALGINYSIVPVKSTPVTEEKPQSTTAPKATATATASATASTQNHNYSKGDVNLDLNVDKIDTNDIQLHLAYLKELSDKSLKLADFDENGKVNIKDTAKICISIAKA